ncbi:hypothetical protein Acr_00g0039000 [Actinidia rufa]|uniref:Uncharacterized protein n=1 Tax=Actinidia rufa TaxID=165716 RepID=A0A7J0DHG8_9ERIC|nr:hypothetical protein Acr_00g0039000 [Actinidia rufa]
MLNRYCDACELAFFFLLNSYSYSFLDTNLDDIFELDWKANLRIGVKDKRGFIASNKLYGSWLMQCSKRLPRAQAAQNPAGMVLVDRPTEGSRAASCCT